MFEKKSEKGCIDIIFGIVLVVIVIFVLNELIPGGIMNWENLFSF